MSSGFIYIYLRLYSAFSERCVMCYVYGIVYLSRIKKKIYIFIKRKTVKKIIFMVPNKKDNVL